MRLPGWFKIAMILWLAIGIPAFVVGQGFRGSFSVLPDPPPFVYSSDAFSVTFGTLVWLMAAAVIYLPLWAIPALLVQWRKMQKRANAKD